MPPTKTRTATARSNVGSKPNCGYTEPTNGAYRPPATPTKNAEAAYAISLVRVTLMPSPRARASSSRMANSPSPYFDRRTHQAAAPATTAHSSPT